MIISSKDARINATSHASPPTGTHVKKYQIRIDDQNDCLACVIGLDKNRDKKGLDKGIERLDEYDYITKKGNLTIGN